MKSTLIAFFTAATAMTLLTSCDNKNEKTTDAGAPGAAAASGEQAFVSAYRKALESADKQTLDSFFHAEGTPAEIVEFFKMMRDIPAGTKLVDVKLETPSAEELAQFSKPMPMPDGKSYKLSVIPSRKLVVTMKTEAANENSTSTATLPVAVRDGKFVIPLPVPAV